MNNSTPFIAARAAGTDLTYTNTMPECCEKGQTYTTTSNESGQDYYFRNEPNTPRKQLEKCWTVYVDQYSKPEEHSESDRARPRETPYYRYLITNTQWKPGVESSIGPGEGTPNTEKPGNLVSPQLELKLHKHGASKKSLHPGPEENNRTNNDKAQIIINTDPNCYRDGRHLSHAYPRPQGLSKLRANSQSGPIELPSDMLDSDKEQKHSVYNAVSIRVRTSQTPFALGGLQQTLHTITYIEGTTGSILMVISMVTTSLHASSKK
ncbi:hypothetical protein C8F04DRAFT_1185238 [Mycena alexandri]|uniref:Uncharacterized protein n=1 Tax=Mycena alexandri TaxID=1745969 RepID=A0AAD6SQE7_9AGAR|nr:hypothetical protein C8F04DRAFT_1185238 [Mycena alexandri]